MEAEISEWGFIMFENEPVLTKKQPTLDELSIEELIYKISELKDEIKACEAEIDKKKAQKTAAEALFGGQD